MFKLKTPYLATTISLLSIASTWAATVEVNGFIGFDSTVISKYDRGNAATSGNPYNAVWQLYQKSQALDSQGKNSASFQTYLFHLDPTIIVNDAATIKGEISTNYGRGGIFGESTQSAKDQTWAGPAYLLSTVNTPRGQERKNALSINQLYTELYTDFGTIQLGRFAQHWGLGAVNHAGNDPWNRYVTAKDGMAIKAKIGHFKITPWWAKIESGTNLSSSAGQREYGFALLYDNPERDLMLGVAYSNRHAKSELGGTNNTIVNEGNTPHTIASAKAKVFSLFAKKIYKKFTFAMEIPLANGHFNNLYNNIGKTTYNAHAILIELNYKKSPKWNFTSKLGYVSGDRGKQDKFSAFYVNPNYQIANLLFSYNFANMANMDNSIWDRYLTNVKYLRLQASYATDKWDYTGALVMAMANEVAKAGGTAFNHEKNYRFNVDAGDQKKYYGTEIDLDLTYHWNQETTVTGSLGYLLAGDYYAFTATANKAKVQNPYLIQAKVGMNF